MTPDANGILYLEETDPITPFQTTINTLQAATSEAFTVNGIQRSFYSDSEVLTTPYTLVKASATVDSGPGGSKVVTISVNISGVTLASGAQNVVLGSVVSGLFPPEIITLVGSAGTTGMFCNLTSGGTLSVRNTTGAVSSGVEMRLGGSYAVPPA